MSSQNSFRFINLMRTNFLIFKGIFLFKKYYGIPTMNGINPKNKLKFSFWVKHVV